MLQVGDVHTFASLTNTATTPSRLRSVSMTSVEEEDEDALEDSDSAPDEASFWESTALDDSDASNDGGATMSDEGDDERGEIGGSVLLEHWIGEMRGCAVAAGAIAVSDV